MINVEITTADGNDLNAVILQISRCGAFLPDIHLWETKAFNEVFLPSYPGFGLVDSKRSPYRQSDTKLPIVRVVCNGPY